MISKRCRHGSIVFQGQMWAVGGYNGRFLATVEQYNFASDVWVPMTATMNVRRGRIKLNRLVLIIVLVLFYVCFN